jgi:hypothetical protein
MGRKLGRAVALGACAAVAVAGLAGAATNVSSTVTLGATLTSGKVSSAKSVCKADRKVVVKYRDATGKVYVFGRDTTNNGGNYQVTPGSTPGTLPFRFFAVAKVKRSGSVTCTEAKSKTRKVEGG